MVNFNYKVKFEYLNRPEKLEQLGFIKFQNDEFPEDELYCMKVRLEPDCRAIRSLINGLNDPEWQQLANINHPKRKAVLKREGLEWEKQPDGSYKIKETPELFDEFCNGMLCVSARMDNDNFPYSILLLKTPDDIFRGGASIVHESCPKVIENLLELGVIYKVRAGYRKPAKTEKIPEA